MSYRDMDCVICARYTRFAAEEPGQAILDLGQGAVSHQPVKVSSGDPLCLEHPVKTEKGHEVRRCDVMKIEPGRYLVGDKLKEAR